MYGIKIVHIPANKEVTEEIEGTITEYRHDTRLLNVIHNSHWASHLVIEYKEIYEFQELNKIRFKTCINYNEGTIMYWWKFRYEHMAIRPMAEFMIEAENDS